MHAPFKATRRDAKTPYGCLTLLVIRSELQANMLRRLQAVATVPGCMLHLLLHAVRGDVARDPIHTLFGQQWDLRCPHVQIYGRQIDWIMKHKRGKVMAEV